ncbi:MAG: TolC family protein [Gammaproteobacteria bacterium]
MNRYANFVIAAGLAAGFSSAAQSQGLSLDALLSSGATAGEQAGKQLIEEALAGGADSGAWRRLQNKTLVPVSAQQAALAALEKNLSVATSRFDAERVKQAVLEARAVFDPVFDLAVSYNRFDTSERTEVGSVRQQFFQPGVPILGTDQSEIDFPQIVTDRTGIDRIVFGVLEEGIVPDTTVFASRDQPNGATETFTYSLGLVQQLPWGPSLDVAVVTTDREVFFNNRGGSYDAPWSSDLVFNLNVPLGQDFGPYSIADTEIKLAEKQSEQGALALESTINTTLLQTQLAYLELVRSLENLLVATENRQLLQRQVDFTQRLFDQRLTTTYDKAQVDAELAGARAQENVAQNSFLVASDSLAVLIEESSGAVRGNIYLPSDYDAWLRQPLDFDGGQALQIAMQERPELRLSVVDVQLSQILERQRKIQTRPDVDLLLSITSSQDGSVFGYDDYFDSVGNVVDPDLLRQSYGVNYRYPWGNQAVKARYAQAQAQVRSSELSRRETGNRVKREVNDALSGIERSRARLGHSNDNLKAARSAYDSLARQREGGGNVNVDELLFKIRDVLQARLSRVSAAIDNKRAEVSLLAAQGIIAKHYAATTARNGLERQRFALLSQQEGFEYLLR